MANILRNFVLGRMNKSLDERLVPQGEYVDALNVRLGSTESSEIGSVENSKGNTQLTFLQYEETGSTTGAQKLSAEARCLGVYEDGTNDRIYWFVHDPAFPVGLTGKLDLIVSLNPTTNNLAYHVVSIDDGSASNTTLNFNPIHLITAVDKIGDLLFFTDNFNPPRVINVLSNYPNPNFNLDIVTAEELMVIKKPPISAPTLTLKAQRLEADDYLETRFICFAYRYQYANGEYSATSQWSPPAFDPDIYRYSFSSNLNDGMLNTITGVDVQFNTGSPLVKAIEILYKESSDNIIKISTKLDKGQEGYANNTNYTFSFNNSKIFTVLPQSELLRLYDNVPIKARAQTIMGNRLVYGNYIEGYDLKDLYNDPLKLEFSANLVQSQSTNTNLVCTSETGSYTYNSSGTTINVADSQGSVSFGSVNTLTDLKAGSGFTLTYVYEHSQFDPNGEQPTSTTPNTEIQFVYTLPSDFSSLFDLLNSEDFKDAIGTQTNIQLVFGSPNSCAGFTMTDNVNCQIPSTLTTATGNVTKAQSGITNATAAPGQLGQPIVINNLTPSVTALKFQLPAMRFVVDPANPSGGAWEFYKIISIDATFFEVGVPRSLHSNRGYEIGIVYMDEFLRSSTALVSANNTVQTTCANSRTINQIQVTIPWGQRAPFWAKYYKFVIKPDQSTYETIYSETFFRDPRSNSVYFLLEGEQAAKIETGQELIVKRDSGGAVEQCTYATVIEKSSKSEGFLSILNPLDPGTVTEPNYVLVPAGGYMEIVPNGFNITSSEETGGNRIAYAAETITFPIYVNTGGWPVGRARVNVLNPAGTAYVDYSIPVNSSITITIKQWRQGGRSGCEYRENTYTSPELISNANYTDFKAWFEGDNIDELIVRDSVSDTGDGSPLTNVYTSGAPLTAASDPVETVTSAEFPVANSPLNSSSQTPNGVNYYQFYRNSDDNGLWLLATGARSCQAGANMFGNNVGGHASNVEIEITVERANSGGVVVFESIPSDALPDLWYENERAYDITAQGQHQGNLRNQDIITQTSALVETGFFNCFTFGNGVESYTIQDSIKGKSFAFGNRVTTTSNQDYREAHRFADLTYSGIFNDESNVNKLNEFNLGLLNFKPLESIFASVQVLFARETDILVLQEDRISYVLAGKDILTDAAGGGALTSVPTVLGQQVARLEEYGISRNPESFAVFGENKFFTDEQRGAVIQLKGGAYNNESLTLISEEGMRGWFRDLFHDNFDSQKLGGFDPYMNEYVLSSNTSRLPFVGDCDLCGTSRNISLKPGAQSSYCVNVTYEVGEVKVDYVLPSGGNNAIITEGNTGSLNELITAETNSTASSGGTIVTEDSTSNNGYTITVLYNGNTFTTGEVFVDGTLSINKNSVYADTLTVIVTSNSIVTDTIEVTTNCPAPDTISIYQVSITANADSGKFIHNEYRWVDGLFISPLHSELVEFSSGNISPIVSQFSKLVGSQGAGVIPDDDAKVTIISNKIEFDDYDFLPNSNSFKYVRSSTFYGNVQADILSLLGVANQATPIVQSSAEEFSATFTMPSGVNNDNLYLIWDYRQSTEIQLCFSSTTLVDACCDCNIPATPAPTPRVTSEILPCTTYTLTSTNNAFVTYEFIVNGPGSATLFYVDERGVNVGPDTYPEGTEVNFCATINSVVVTGNGSAVAGSACGGKANTNRFWWRSCEIDQDFLNQEATLTADDEPLIICASNIPEASSTAVTITAGALCTNVFYLARECGADENSFLQLAATDSVPLAAVGDVVKCRLNENAGVRDSCATIISLNMSAGAGGDVLSLASGCADVVNCPQPATEIVYQWRIDARPGGGSSSLIQCNTAGFPTKIALFTTVPNISSTLTAFTVFYIDKQMKIPFQGNNKFYTVSYPTPPATTTPASQFYQGIARITQTGTATQISDCI